MVFLDTILEFKISLPFDSDVHCLGVVRRIEKSSQLSGTKNISLYQIAAYFVKLDKKVKSLINNLN